jgi:hypothetical protein
MSPLLSRVGVQLNARADRVSSFLSAKRARNDTVIDAGAYDGSDYTLPAWRIGYNAYSFEFSPVNQDKVVGTLNAAGLRLGTSGR